MKRYDQALILKGFHQKVIMREEENGNYVRYEDVENLVLNLLYEAGKDMETARQLIEKWE